MSKEEMKWPEKKNLQNAQLTVSTFKYFEGFNDCLEQCKRLNEPCKCGPPGSGEEYCNIGCEPQKEKEMETMSDIEKTVMLAPCPFCGDIEPILAGDGINLGRWVVCCRNCYGRIIAQKTEEEAIKNWNTRTAPEQQRLDEPDEKEIYEFMCTNYPHLVPRNNLTGKDLQEGIRVIKMVKHISQKFGHAVVSVPSVENVVRKGCEITLKSLEEIVPLPPKDDLAYANVDWQKDIIDYAVRTAIKNLIENK